MLPRAAARALKARPAPPSPFPAGAASTQWIRRYGKNDKPRPPPRQPSQSDSGRRNVGSDYTWKPSQPIDFATAKTAAEKAAAERAQSPLQSQNTSQDAEFSSRQPEDDASAIPERNTVQYGRAKATERAGSTQEEFSTAQDEFSGPKSSKASTAPTAEGADGTAAPSGPLPDLRQGIPSTFAAEFGATEPKPSQKASEQESTVSESIEEPEPVAGGAGGGRGSGDLPKSAFETSVDRRRNKVANYSYLMALVFGLTGAVYLGRPWESEEEAAQHPDISSSWNITTMYDRAKARMSGQMSYYTEPTFPKLLPEMDPRPPYTLVLSLEDMLVHSEWTSKNGWRTAKRPGVDYFIRYLSQYYELVIFTSLPMQVAEPVIKKLDPFHIVMWPLFREATRYEKGEYIKDLSYLNRDLSKTLIIDTKASHTKYQPSNAIILPPWDGTPGDRKLVSLIPFLEHIATMGVQDVRKAIESFKGADIPTEFAIRETRAREKFKAELDAERAKRPKHSAAGWLMGALGMKGHPQGGMVVGEKTVSEGLAEGKMLSDQIREQGIKAYEAMEKQIRENGEAWLKEMAEEEKKMQEEQIKSMKSGMTGWFGGKKE
ncbi:uncharacterized protein BDZ99DRAFT_429489 [Mytilinidion resinicola]|uniref:Mitochondrial import inner membrane translocase subunit TIM50 n=1 Tax=Mytilinidion resinicola TaxID=574789 RepID=A0A6A6XYT6_9PEZI|nr:uncharacterized protein BDZ99DRAFT_429489 [Mytilinidion resinicola]KAF2801662.1 hypothetical protein BDZ99DRAFT_429489 [Mytilinidion resinicola]